MIYQNLQNKRPLIYNQARRTIVFNFRKEEENLYTVLGCKTTASGKEVKLAYYKMAKKYHPDFNTEGD